MKRAILWDWKIYGRIMRGGGLAVLIIGLFARDKGLILAGAILVFGGLAVIPIEERRR